MNMNSEKRVTFVNNNILYSWDSVPEIKYENWLKMQEPVVREDFSVDGFPFFIQIEPTNFCNLKCPVCPAGGFGFKRKKRHMKLKEFQSVIDDMENYLLFITLWDWGEPLLNPDLPEMIRYAAERDIKTVTSTNCNCRSFHQGDYLERLLRSGLSTLIFAVDSPSQDSYQVYRKKGELNTALDAVRKSVLMKKKLGSGPLLVLRMVVMKHNEHEIRAMRSLARELGVDRFSLKTMNPLYTSESSDSEIVPSNPKYQRYAYKKDTFERIKIDYKCDIVPRQCTIHSNGDVAPCCWWFDNDYMTNNCFTDGGLTKTWNSSPYRNLRRRLADNKDSIRYCRTCSMNYQFSRTGWFPEMLDLTKNRREQYIYLIKRNLELNMHPKQLQRLIRVKNTFRALLKR